ncbi:MAG: 16S rRNA (guanine(966)-N(2))-methyltransferase RsmD [Armatimonadota bacterium]
MRVIGGTAKGTRLLVPKGADVRPTSDAMRETLFQMLCDMVPGARVLDLFAGSGAVGIEALSRGASHCLFVDKSRRCIETITRNLEACRLRETAKVRKADVRRVLHELEEDEPYDVAFADPPYGWPGLVRLVEGLVVERRGVSDSGIVIVQHRRNVEWPPRLMPSRAKRFGDTMLTFFAPPELGT